MSPATASDAPIWIAKASDSPLWIARAADGLANSPLVKAVTLSKPGIVGYWRLNETSGATAHDSWDGHDGTLNGTITQGVLGALPGDPNDAAMTFDGSTGYISVPGSGLGTTGPFSVAAWIDPPTLSNAGGGGFPTFIDKPNSGGSNFRFFVNQSDGSAQLRCAGLSADARTGINQVPLASWTHLLGVYDPVGGKLNIYVNGTLAIGQNVTGAPGAANANAMDVGQSAAVGNRFFQGGIKEVVVAFAAWTPADAADLYHVGKNALGALATASDGRI